METQLKINMGRQSCAAVRAASILTVCFFVIFSVHDVQAQQRAQLSNAEIRPGVLHELALIYADEINLSEDQKKEIATIRAENRLKMREQAASREPSRTVRRAERERRSAQAEMRIRHQQQMLEEIKLVLTDEQYATLQAKRDERINSTEGLQEQMYAAYISVITERMGLSEERADRVLFILEEERNSVIALRRARGDRGPDRQMVEQMRNQRDQSRAQLAELLTEEELAQWTELWQEMMPRRNVQMQQRGDERRRGNPQND
ncbi:MAG: Spy/CpxP family protein refolding chaperone [Balneolales bacterium]|nr:Spy/CpxP family protein refolding chaperone [Balneolales bacterium]